MAPESYSRSFIKDNVTAIVGHLLAYMKGIILIPLIIKTVGVTIYGGYVLVMSLLGVVFGLSSLGVGFRAKRFMPSAKVGSARRDLFYPQFFFQMLSLLLLSLLFFFLHRQINTYIFKNEVTYSAWIIPFYLLFYFLYSQGADYFRYTSRITYMTMATLSFPCSHLIVVLIFLYYYHIVNINILLLSEVFSALLIFIACFRVILGEIGIRFAFYDKKGLLSDIKLGFPLVLNFIVDFILSGSDRYLIAFYLTVSAVGYYNPGYVLGSVIILIAKAMCTVMPQLMSKAVDGNNEHEAQRMLNYAIKIFLILAVPFVLGSAVLSKSILTLFANREVAENAYIVTPIVALGTLFCGLSFLLSNIFWVRLKTAALFKMNVFAAGFNLLANFIFLYLYRNINVAAITTLVSYFIGFMYAYKVASKDWQIDFQVPALSKSLVASIVMAAVLYWISFGLRDIGLSIALVCELSLGLSTYVAVLLILKTFSLNELLFVRNLVWR